MGKWAQYRYRGRGATAAALIDPPIHPDQVNTGQIGTEQVDLFTYGPFPDGASTVQVQYRTHGSSTWIDGADVGADTEVLLISGTVVDDEYDFQARWMDSFDNPISDWSDTWSLTIVP